jgi:hypothetical protein
MQQARTVDFWGDFKMFLEDNAAVLHSTRFGNKAHFHFNGYVNKQNMYVYVCVCVCVGGGGGGGSEHLA